MFSFFEIEVFIAIYGCTKFEYFVAPLFAELALKLVRTGVYYSFGLSGYLKPSGFKRVGMYSMSIVDAIFNPFYVEYNFIWLLFWEQGQVVLNIGNIL